MPKEFIRPPVNIGDSQGFSIPKKEMKLDFSKRYRLKIEEVSEE